MIIMIVRRKYLYNGSTETMETCIAWSELFYKLHSTKKSPCKIVHRNRFPISLLLYNKRDSQVIHRKLRVKIQKGNCWEFTMDQFKGGKPDN